MTYWKMSEVIEILDRLEILKDRMGFGLIKPIKSRRPWCTCRKCGFLYDECVCRHNEIVQAFMDLRPWNKGDIE
ncbi:MAG TPA: hypothetical protein ENI23_16430 [bacterium]|nr:hypothetical protein [bacterium]